MQCFQKLVNFALIREINYRVKYNIFDKLLTILSKVRLILTKLAELSYIIINFVAIFDFNLI